MPGGVAPKFGSEKVSRYTGVSQLQLRVSRYTAQLSHPQGGTGDVHPGFCGGGERIFWEFGEAMDSARGVAAIVVCCRNTSCNCFMRRTSSQWSKNYCILSAVSSAIVFCNRLCEGMFQTCFECGRRGQVLQSHPLADFTPSPNTRTVG